MTAPRMSVMTPSPSVPAFEMLMKPAEAVAHGSNAPTIRATAPIRRINAPLDRPPVAAPASG